MNASELDQALALIPVDTTDARFIEVRSYIRAWRAALLAATARSTGDSDKGPGTPPDTSWNKRSSPPGGEWQGIDTAPRDGTWIIVYLASWRCPASKMSIVRWASCGQGEGWHDDEEEDGPILSPVTHWQCLPAPPREAVGVGIEGASRTESTVARCDATAGDAHNHSEGGAA